VEPSQAVSKNNLRAVKEANSKTDAGLWLVENSMMLVDVRLMMLDVDVDAADDVDDAAAANAAEDDDADDDGDTLNKTFVCLYDICACFFAIFRFFQVGENTLSNQMRGRVLL